jgi:hypothetical protein
MKHRIAAWSSVAAASAATALFVAVQAGAGPPERALPIGCNGSLQTDVTRSPQATGAPESVHYVSGYSIRERIRGSLEGTWKWSGPNDGFDAFLRNLRYTPATGVMRFRVPELFKGSIAGVGRGTLTIVGANVQMFKPGTPLYDFSNPSSQPGTTGDPRQWLAGWCVHTITGGTGAFKGASGVINFRDIRYLTDANYWGIVRLSTPD